MATMPNEATYAARLFVVQANKQLGPEFRHHLTSPVPENTTIMAVALAIDEGTEDAVLVAIEANPNVNVCKPVRKLPDAGDKSMRTPGWTPPGQRWIASVTFLGKHEMIPEEPE